MRPLVVAFSGRIGSGKSSVSTALAERLQLHRASFGDYVRQVAAYLGLDAVSREVLQELGAFLARYPGAFCRKLLDHGNYVPGEALVIDGIRHEEIAEQLRTQVAPARFVLVYLKADETTLERRFTEERSGGVDLHSMEQHSTERQVLVGLPERADITVLNDGQRPLDAVVDEILRKLEEHA